MEYTAPHITVLLAAYRGDAFIRAQLDSLLQQDYPDFSVIVSDDGSPDDTPSVLDEYAARYPDRVSRHSSGQRFGNAQDHFMHLLRSCGTGYCMFCDQDDVWMPDKLSATMEKMLEAEQDHPGQPVLVHTDLTVVDGALNTIAPSFLQFSQLDGNRTALHQLLVQNTVTGCTMLMNPPLVTLACETPTPRGITMHDAWIALIASALGCVSFLDRPTMYYRQHGNNSVGAKNSRSISYILSRISPKLIRTSMEAGMVQAGLFADAFREKLSPEQLALCRAYAACPGQGWLRRKYTFLHYRLLKYGWKRILAQLLLG